MCVCYPSAVKYDIVIKSDMITVRLENVEPLMNMTAVWTSEVGAKLTAS
jgi:hypothetical protein